MVRTGEVRPDNNLTGAYARNVPHKDRFALVRFFYFPKKHRLFVCSVLLNPPLMNFSKRRKISKAGLGAASRCFLCLDISVRAFYKAGILSFEKTFGGDAEIERK